MAYEKTVWQKGMVLTAENLNKIENALENITGVVNIGTNESGLNTVNTTTNNLTVSDTSNLGETNISGATTIGTQETAADLNIYGDLTATGDVTFGTVKTGTPYRFIGTATFNTDTAIIHGKTTIDTIYTGNISSRTDGYENLRIFASGQLALEGTDGIYINSNTVAINGAAVATQAYVNNQISGKADSTSLAAVATSGLYSDLINPPTIPTVPTNISAFTNDKGYLTTHQDISGKLDIPSYSNLQNGTYILQMTLNDGVPTYEWIPGE